MSDFKLGFRSRRNLRGVHPDLAALAYMAIELTKVDFTVTEGLRGMARQAKLVRQGRSRTMNSRHLTGHAIDVVPYVNGRLIWSWPLIYRIEDAFRASAAVLGLVYQWGGDWDMDGSVVDESWRDGPHRQLPWKTFPPTCSFIPSTREAKQFLSEVGWKG